MIGNSKSFHLGAQGTFNPSLLAAFDDNGLWVPSLRISHCVFFVSETRACSFSDITTPSPRTAGYKERFNPTIHTLHTTSTLILPEGFFSLCVCGGVRMRSIVYTLTAIRQHSTEAKAPFSDATTPPSNRRPQRAG